MNATSLFFLFLKKECTIAEYRFFKERIIKEHGNKYFRKRPLYTSTFVEDYLARNGRALDNFMTRIFILAPNLVHSRCLNPRMRQIQSEFYERNKDKTIPRKVRYFDIRNNTDKYRIVREPVHFRFHQCGMYINYYKKKWTAFLKNHVESDKKIHSPFKIGEVYDFKFIADDSCIQHT